MFIRVRGILRTNFGLKKAPRSSRLDLGVRSHGPTGCKMGSLWIRFPVGREWKLIDQFFKFFILFQYLWIRFLVGREWKPDQQKEFVHPAFFGYAFPLEGNGNTLRMVADLISFPSLWIRFPVGREWKHNSAALKADRVSGLWIRFPVGREWKPTQKKLLLTKTVALDTLSRWKGMETGATLANARLVTTNLWIRFPVRREWKPVTAGRASVFTSILWIRFPVGRESKH